MIYVDKNINNMFKYINTFNYFKILLLMCIVISLYLWKMSKMIS